MKSYDDDFFEKGQLKIHFDLYKIGLPADDPVYTLIKVLEDLNYESLLAQYKTKGRKGYSKTDISATFMRMKEDHYFIVHTYLCIDMISLSKES